MTFTYSLTPPYTDLSRIRYAVRDTDSASAIFSDEEIAFRLAEASDWKHAVIDLLQGKVMEWANTPQFSAGNLSVNLAENRKTLMELLRLKRQEYGIAQITATTVYAWRPDSGQTEAPTFSENDE